MRIVTLLAAVLCAAGPVSAQEVAGAPAEGPPSGFAAIELARSRSCVTTLAQVDALEQTLAPMARRSQRLQAVHQAILIEERAVVDSLRADDPVEAAVRSWFADDLALAERFIASRDSSVLAQRNQEREAIKGVVQAAVDSIQAEAQGIIDATGDLAQRAGPCEGAIFVRPAVLEACRTQTSPVCGPAGASEPEGAYRFVDTPEDLWDVQQLRPWTDPQPLRVGPDGQLTGARTVGYARHGNVVLTIAFAPLLQDRSEITDEQAAAFRAIVDSLGFEFTHPDIAFAPSLAVRTTLPQPLAGETAYVLHFGAPDSADVIWSGPAATGAPLEDVFVLTPAQLARLANGSALNLTALREVAPGDNEAVFTMGVTDVNQARAVTALVAYMSAQLSRDLARIAPGSG